MQIPDKPLTHRMFAIFDRNASGEVDFGEFLTAVWTFCIFTRASLASLAFNLMDTDGSGSIEATEVAALIRELADDPSYQVSTESLVEGKTPNPANEAKEADGEQKEAEADAFVPKLRISEEMFLAFALRHPAVTVPALELQKKLRSAIGGDAFWEGAALRRGGGEDQGTVAQEIALAKTFAAHAETSKASGSTPKGSAGTATVHPETVFSALNRISSGGVALTEMDTAAAQEASASHSRIAGNVSAAAIATALASGLAAVVEMRAHKHAPSKKKNTGESEPPITPPSFMPHTGQLHATHSRITAPVVSSLLPFSLPSPPLSQRPPSAPLPPRPSGRRRRTSTGSRRSVRPPQRRRHSRRRTRTTCPRIPSRPVAPSPRN